MLNIKKDEGIRVLVVDMNEGDFAIANDRFEINSKSISKSLSLLLETKEATLKIEAEERNISIDDLIDLYLLSYKHNKIDINLFLSNKNEKEAKEIKETLNSILKVKKELANDSSDELKNILLKMYPILSEVAKKIIDKRYKEEISFENKKVCIIDYHNFLHRTYHGMAPLRDNQGRPTAIIKNLTLLLSKLSKQDFDYLIFADEGTKEINVRKDIYPNYKSSRKETEAELKEQIISTTELIKKMGLSLVSKEGYEGDDIMISYAESFVKFGAEVVIYTTDKDMYQAAKNPKIKIFDYSKGIFITSEDCIKKFGVGFEDCVMIQALWGDASDDVPGVAGVGQKTAAEYISQYKTLDNLYENIANIEPNKKVSNKREKLIAGRDNAYISLRLVSLFNNLAEEEIMKNSIFDKNCLDKVKEELVSYQINY